MTQTGKGTNSGGEMGNGEWGLSHLMRSNRSAHHDKSQEGQSVWTMDLLVYAFDWMLCQNKIVNYMFIFYFFKFTLYERSFVFTKRFHFY